MMHNILNNFDELVEEFRINFTLCPILEHEMSLEFFSSITTYVFCFSCLIRKWPTFHNNARYLSKRYLTKRKGFLASSF